MPELAAHDDFENDDWNDPEDTADSGPNWREVRKNMSHEDLFWTRDYCTTPEYKIVHQPEHEFRDALVDIQRYSKLVHVKLPEGVHCGSFSDFNYFSQMIRRIWSGMIDQFTETTRDKLAGKQHHRPAKYTVDKNDIATVELGIRRSPFPVQEEEIAKAVYYEGSSMDGDYDWTYYRYNQECYPRLIRPYVEKQYPGTANPFDWAFSRTEIAAGFATAMGFIDECPPLYLAAPFKRIARDVCNTVPESMLEPRNYQLNKESKALITAARQLLGEKFCPETACLLLENADSLNRDMLYDNRVIAHLESLPTYVANGLIIDRLSQLFQQLIKHGTAEPKALKQSLEIVSAVYNHDKNPWWFKEDIDFATYIDEKDPKSSIEQMQKIAQASGHAFIYAWELYHSTGIELVQNGKIDQDTAINIYARIAKAYGIGNLERAKSVLQFVETIINDTPTANRKHTLDLFLEHMETESTRCEILSKMEGTDAKIDLPGLPMLLVHALGRDTCEEAQIDRNTIESKTIQQLATHIDQPLEERAKGKPATDIIPRTRLLTPHIDVARLLTTGAATEESLLATPQTDKKTVLTRVFEFYAKLRKECGHTNSKVAGIYFAMCANKMPDPLNPPDGFLHFLEKWDQLPIHGYSLRFFHHPEERSYVSRQNARRSVEKQTFLLDILDLWLLGYLKDEHELMSILEWMTEEASSETKEKITAEVRTKELEDDEQRKAEDPEYEPLAADNFDERVKLYAWSKIRDLEVEVWKERATKTSSFIFKAVQVAYMASIGLIDTNTAQNYVETLTKKIAEIEPLQSAADDQYTFAVDTSISDLLKYNVLDEDKLRERLQSDPEQTLEIIEAILQILMKCKETRDLIDKEKEAQKDQYNPRDPREIMEHRVRIALIWEKLSREVIDTLGDILNPDFLGQIINFETRFELLLWLAHLQSETNDYRSQRSRHPEQNVAAITEFTANLVASIGSVIQQENLLLPVSSGQTAELDTLRTNFQSNIQSAIPSIKSQIEAVRQNSKGLVSIGGKIHVLHPIDSDKFYRFLNAFGFRHTGFKLIHANHSLCLPATLSAEELALIITALEKLQIIDSELPELQMSIPGRLPKRDCAILGSSILLATEKGKERFDEQSFCTTHDNATGARMMAYDAYEPNTEMPNMDKLTGRTDMLGRRSLGDLKLYQQLGTILEQRHIKEGPFAHLADEFEKRYRQILSAHDMEDILNESWIYDSKDDRQDNKASKKHYQTVKRCTDAYRDCAQQYKKTHQEEGIIFEVRALFDWLEENISLIQKTL